MAGIVVKTTYKQRLLGPGDRAKKFMPVPLKARITTATALPTVADIQSVMLFSHPPGRSIDLDGAFEQSVPITASTAGKVLTSDGTTASWQPGGGGGSPDPIIMPDIPVSGIFDVGNITTTLTLQKAGKTVTLMMPSVIEGEAKSHGSEVDVGPFDLSTTGYTPSVNYGGTSISYPFIAEDDGPVAAFLVLDWTTPSAATIVITKADGSNFTGGTGGYDTGSISWATDA